MYIKGFDKNLCCRGFQFEVGKTYDTGVKDEDVKICEGGAFHFCKSIRDVHDYYNVNRENRFCEIKVLGALVETDGKCCSNKIKIVREITGDELNTLTGKINGNTGLFNTGCHNVGDCNTGDYNVGDCNAGICNAGNGNTGDSNIGYHNAGICNAGICNTGICNTGNDNSGSFNKSNGNNGFFNTIEPTVQIFNVDSGMTQNEFYNSEYWSALRNGNFSLTQWINYTDKEKANNKKKQLVGGYLKEYTYEEACANWWQCLCAEDKKIIMSIPNFNAEIFKEITGIEVENDNNSNR
jgi:hypothetical protein